jgi:hypothetical protein
MICIKCNEQKADTEFETRADTKKKRKTCKVCRTKYVQSYKKDIINGTRVKRPLQEIVDGKKKCVKCPIDSPPKPLSEFTTRSDTSHGYRLECNECKRKYMQEYYESIYNSVRRKRCQVDVDLRLIRAHRHAIWKTMKNKRHSSIHYLSCTLAQLKEWLFFQFDENMTFDNYGSKWTLDHVLPLSLFDLTNVKEQQVAFNWKNLRPSTDNFEKNNKLRLHDFFNTFISSHRFIQLKKLNLEEYQGLNESLNWLRNKLSR